VLIIDDLIATGGTAVAAINLVEKLGGEVVEFAVVVDLPDIGGSKKIAEAGVSVYAQTEFEGD
jgi:adenine phosphoribosyltransferase